MLARKLADRWLRPEVARFVSCVALAISATLAGLMFVTNNGGQTAFGTSLGLDYGEFYVVGQILNEGSSSRLFDLDYQDERLHQLLPKLSKDEHLPFVYPPFLAVLFQPLAKLPFPWSVAVWLAISVGLYATAIGLMLRSCESIEGSERTTAWLLALSFSPFAMECGLGGQLSAIGAVVLASSWTLHKRGKPLAAGLVLAVLFYKPTLLILILPMLLISRSWRVLAGLGVGGLILALVSWLVVGSAGCLDFLGLMAGYSRSGGSVGQGFKTIKYVDLTAFLRLIGIAQSLCRPLACVLGLPILGFLMISWARTLRGCVTPLTWSATIILTPTLNIYGPIYDVTVSVPGILIGVNAIRIRNSDSWPDSLRWLLAFLYLSALVTQPLAMRLGFQPLTLSLLAIGAYFLWWDLRSRSKVS